MSLVVRLQRDGEEISTTTFVEELVFTGVEFIDAHDGRIVAEVLPDSRYLVNPRNRRLWFDRMVIQEERT